MDSKQIEGATEQALNMMRQVLSSGEADRPPYVMLIATKGPSNFDSPIPLMVCISKHCPGERTLSSDELTKLVKKAASEMSAAAIVCGYGDTIMVETPPRNLASYSAKTGLTRPADKSGWDWLLPHGGMN